MFLNRHQEKFSRNHRMLRVIRSLERLPDLDALVRENPDLV